MYEWFWMHPFVYKQNSKENLNYFGEIYFSTLWQKYISLKSKSPSFVLAPIQIHYCKYFKTL